MKKQRNELDGVSGIEQNPIYNFNEKEKSTHGRVKSGVIMFLFFVIQMAIIIALIAPWQGARLHAFVGDTAVQVTSSQTLTSKTFELFPQYFTIRIRDADTNKEVEKLHVYLISFGATYLHLDIIEREQDFFGKNIFDHAFDEMNWFEDNKHKKNDMIQIKPERVFYEEKNLSAYIEEILNKYPDKIPVLQMSEIVGEIKQSLDAGIMQEITVDVRSV